MSDPIKQRSGFRYFECAECLHAWHEASRDCFSPSGDPCSECGEFVHPCAYEYHPEWPVDSMLNLLPDVDYEKLA